MTRGDDLNDGLEPLTREALGWVTRLTSGSATHEDARAFSLWRAQGPAHESAFLQAAAFRRTVRLMDLAPASEQSSTVLPFRRSPVLDRRALFTGGGAIAASAAGAWLVARPPLGLWPSLAELTASQRTGPGERSRLTPTAGVEVEMNARSALSVTRQGRGLELITGEAFVAVKDAGAPFQVAVGDDNLSTRAGSFNIRTGGQQTCITCLEGEVEHRRGVVRTLIRAGEQLNASPDGRARLASVDPDLALAWRNGLLMFRNTPLSDAIEEINRYRTGKIILTNSALGSRPVNGIFHTDQVEDAVAQIQQLLHLGVTPLPGGVVLLG